MNRVNRWIPLFVAFEIKIMTTRATLTFEFKLQTSNFTSPRLVDNFHCNKFLFVHTPSYTVCAVFLVGMTSTVQAQIDGLIDK